MKVICPFRKCSKNANGECATEEITLYAAYYGELYFPYCHIFECREDPYEVDFKEVRPW